MQSDGPTELPGKFRLAIWFLQCLGEKELLSSVNVPKKTQESDVFVGGMSSVNRLCGASLWENLCIFAS